MSVRTAMMLIKTFFETCHGPTKWSEEHVNEMIGMIMTAAKTFGNQEKSSHPSLRRKSLVHLSWILEYFLHYIPVAWIEHFPNGVVLPNVIMSEPRT